METQAQKKISRFMFPLLVVADGDQGIILTGA